MQSKFQSHESIAEVPANQPVALSILILDDDPADRKLLEVKLNAVDSEFEVYAAETQLDALGILSNQRIDCMILDYHLADGNTEPLIETLRVTHPYLPMIILSGQGSEQKAAAVLRLGAADYLPKRVATEAALARAIDHATSQFRLKESLEQERRQLLLANKMLQQQGREIQSFYHTVSHELKTPITAIREFNSLLNEGILGEINQDQRDALDTSLNCCDRLIRLVNDLFDAARIETGKLRLHKEQTDLAAVINHEVKIMLPAAEHKSISLQLMPYEVPLMLDADPARLGQVLCNLLGNAVKYTQSGGSIAIRVDGNAGDGYLRVEVEDNGPGIEEAHAEFIFNRMYQCAEQAEIDRSSQNGMGIGLFLSQQIVELHGGELRFTSKPGQGTTFAFTLPIEGTQ